MSEVETCSICDRGTLPGDEWVTLEGGRRAHLLCAEPPQKFSIVGRMMLEGAKAAFGGDPDDEHEHKVAAFRRDLDATLRSILESS